MCDFTPEEVVAIQDSIIFNKPDDIDNDLGIRVVTCLVTGDPLPEFTDDKIDKRRKVLGVN